MWESEEKHGARSLREKEEGKLLARAETFAKLLIIRQMKKNAKEMINSSRGSVSSACPPLRRKDLVMKLELLGP